MSDNGYILTEIWRPRPEWLGLSGEERQAFFDDRVGPLLMSLVSQGAEIIACTVNDNTGSERMDYRYTATWRVPDKAFSDRLEAAAKGAGFLDYFEQVNISGPALSPDLLNADMISVSG